jgi:hypothetical protein
MIGPCPVFLELSALLPSSSNSVAVSNKRFIIPEKNVYQSTAATIAVTKYDPTVKSLKQVDPVFKTAFTIRTPADLFTYIRLGAP